MAAPGLVPPSQSPFHIASSALRTAMVSGANYVIINLKTGATFQLVGQPMLSPEPLNQAMREALDITQDE